MLPAMTSSMDTRVRVHQDTTEYIVKMVRSSLNKLTFLLHHGRMRRLHLTCFMHVLSRLSLFHSYSIETVNENSWQSFAGNIRVTQRNRHLGLITHVGGRKMFQTFKLFLFILKTPGHLTLFLNDDVNRMRKLEINVYL